MELPYTSALSPSYAACPGANQSASISQALASQMEEAVNATGEGIAGLLAPTQSDSGVETSPTGR